MDSSTLCVLLGEPQSHEGAVGARSQNRRTGQSQHTLNLPPASAVAAAGLT